MYLKSYAFKMMLSLKQRCSIFDIHSYIQPFRDQFNKEMLIFFKFVIDRN